MRALCLAFWLQFQIVAPSLSAQRITGVVSDSISRAAIPGAVVVLLDTSGMVRRRSISDNGGRYTLPKFEGPLVVRVTKMGFRPAERSILDDASRNTVVLDLDLARIPSLLEPVRVIGNSACPRTDDAEQALTLWAQARMALLSTVVMRDLLPVKTKRLHYERTIAPRTGAVVRQQVSVDTLTRDAVPFLATRTASEFVRMGFGETSGQTRTLYAPDASVLLADAFTERYCFHVTDDDPSRPSQVGLGFRVGERRRDRTDIEGVLWIDTTARTIKDLDYRYVSPQEVLNRLRSGYPRREPPPRGQVVFHTHSNGLVFVERWFIRDNARESGGVLAQVEWTDGSRWQSVLPMVKIEARRHDGTPAPNVVLKLRDTDYYSTADARGEVALIDLLPGPYGVDLVDPILDSLGLTVPSSLTITATSDSAAAYRLEVPTLDAYVARHCIENRGKQRLESGTAWVVGRVVTAQGVGIKDAVFGITENGAAWNAATALGKTDSEGKFAYCSLDLGSRVQLWLLRQPGGPPHLVPLELQKKITAVPIALSSRN